MICAFAGLLHVSASSFALLLSVPMLFVVAERLNAIPPICVQLYSCPFFVLAAGSGREMMKGSFLSLFVAGAATGVTEDGTKGVTCHGRRAHRCRRGEEEKRGVIK